jgi:hypothetical protein
MIPVPIHRDTPNNKRTKNTGTIGPTKIYEHGVGYHSGRNLEVVSSESVFRG